MEKQTAGRTALGDLAPKFAELNDDVLFGEVWSRTELLSLRDRSLITVVALVAGGITDGALRYHLQNARKQGVTKTEMVEAMTHVAFYAGWPRAWAVFPLLREAYADSADGAPEPLFGMGEPNEAFARYFVGRSYVKPLSLEGVKAFNVTFEPGCRNSWHVHHGGGQILLCTDGLGWYQEWGSPARKLVPGEVVEIRPEVRHWHGAVRDRWFTHVALEVPSEEGRTEWLDPVGDEFYLAL